jgi:hypothetical protein
MIVRAASVSTQPAAKQKIIIGVTKTIMSVVPTSGDPEAVGIQGARCKAAAMISNTAAHQQQQQQQQQRFSLVEHKRRDAGNFATTNYKLRKGWHWMTQDIPADHLGREPQAASLTAAHPAIRPPNNQLAAYASETYSPARRKAMVALYHRQEWATVQNSNKLFSFPHPQTLSTGVGYFASKLATHLQVLEQVPH